MATTQIVGQRIKGTDKLGGKPDRLLDLLRQSELGEDFSSNANVYVLGETLPPKPLAARNRHLSREKRYGPDGRPQRPESIKDE
jgi:hypothetical protein